MNHLLGNTNIFKQENHTDHRQIFCNRDAHLHVVPPCELRKGKGHACLDYEATS
jgi:hypothetical protein